MHFWAITPCPFEPQLLLESLPSLNAADNRFFWHTRAKKRHNQNTRKKAATVDPLKVKKGRSNQAAPSSQTSTLKTPNSFSAAIWQTFIIPIIDVSDTGAIARLKDIRRTPLLSFPFSVFFPTLLFREKGRKRTERAFVFHFCPPFGLGYVMYCTIGTVYTRTAVLQLSNGGSRCISPLCFLFI